MLGTTMDDETRASGSGLRGALTTLRRRRWIIICCLLFVPAAAVLASLAQEKQYSASASLLFRDPGLDRKLFESPVLAPSTDPDRQAETNLRLVSLDIVAQRAAKRLGGGRDARQVADKVTVAPAGPSDVASVTATDPVPRNAARLANAFAREYVAFR